MDKERFGSHGPPEMNREPTEYQPHEYRFAQLEDLSVLKPGDRVDLANSGELDQFEIALVTVKLPEAKLDYPNWLHRQRLSLAVKPLNFWGSLRSISAVILERPYSQLRDYQPGAQPVDIDAAERQTVGFKLTADRHSSGKGKIGIIEVLVFVIQSRGNDKNKKQGELSRKIFPVASRKSPPTPTSDTEKN